MSSCLCACMCVCVPTEKFTLIISKKYQDLICVSKLTSFLFAETVSFWNFPQKKANNILNKAQTK